MVLYGHQSSFGWQVSLSRRESLVAVTSEMFNSSFGCCGAPDLMRSGSSWYRTPVSFSNTNLKYSSVYLVSYLQTVSSLSSIGALSLETETKIELARSKYYSCPEGDRQLVKRMLSFDNPS